MDIDSSDTRSHIAYGYVLTLDGGSLSCKYVKKILFYHDLLCKHRLFLLSMHLDNQIVIFKVANKNVNVNLTYENERQIYKKLK